MKAAILGPIALAAAVMAGCGGGGTKTVASTTTTPEVTVTTAAVKTATGGSGTGTAGGCPSIGPVPSSANYITQAKVDFNGNGTPDTLRVYSLSNGWHARGEIGGVGFDDEVISGPGPMQAFGGAKVNGDATEEAWIKVGQGGNGDDILTFFVYGQCKLRQVRLNGTPANFSLGYGPTASAGLSCFMSGVGLTVTETTSTNGVNYSGTDKLYKLSLGPPPSLVLAQTTAATGANPPGGPSFDQLSTFHCGSLSDP
ncbi:MAG TPA: hypothetical protein VNY84_01275 [Acidimicrobiales bacterium]|jgi:hypothetical protein|nr:hypothetical protein [Acidimicrobiales bacterium]